MTYDELVRFAAGKLAVEIAYADDGMGWQYMSEDHEGWWDFYLTSPDLFLKGLAACPHYKELVIYTPQIEGDDTMIKMYVGKSLKMCKKPSEIPFTFWQCWAEVEGK